MRAVEGRGGHRQRRRLTHAGRLEGAPPPGSLSKVGEPSIVTLGHISDLHATAVRAGGLRPLLSKRVLGWLSWQVRRHQRYRPSVLEALAADLDETAPDQLAITGDLTNVALEDEFPAAAAWLARLGPPARVFAVPGNHDAYVAVPFERGLALWSDYLRSDPEARQFGAEPGQGFPSLRLRGPLALVGLCSALPTLPFLASGRLGAEQLRRLERLLTRLRDAGRCRVVLIHHPPEVGVVSARRALRGAPARGGVVRPPPAGGGGGGGGGRGRPPPPALGEVLRRCGAELLLHGHLHRTRVGRLAGPEGPIPVVCVPSASHAGPAPERRAAYHLLDIEPRAGGRPRIRMRTRGYDPASGRFTGHGPEPEELP